MDILRLLPYSEYQAAINANAPTALNPFATIADLIADTSIYTGDGTLTANRTVTQNEKQLNFLGTGTILDTYTEIYIWPDQANAGIYLYTGNNFGNGSSVEIDQRAGGDYVITSQHNNQIQKSLSLLTSSSGLDYFNLVTGENNSIELNANGFKIETSLGKGAYYNADYSTTGIAAHGDRWIPDAGYVKANSGIYGGSGSLVAGTTTVTMAVTDKLLFSSLNGPYDLFTIDAVNNRIGIGTATPTQGLHIENTNAYLKSGYMGIGSAFAVPTQGQMLKITTNDVDYAGSGPIEAVRIDLYTRTTDTTYQGVDVRFSGGDPVSFNAANLGGSPNQIFLFDANYTNANVTGSGNRIYYGIRSRAIAINSGAGELTNIGGYFSAANGDNNIAIVIQDGTEVDNRVLVSSTVTPASGAPISGVGTWVDINTLVTIPNTIYDSDDTLTADRVVSGGASRRTLTFNELSGFIASIKAAGASGEETNFTVGQGFVSIVKDNSPAVGASFEFNLSNPSGPYVEVRTNTGGASAQTSQLAFPNATAARTWTLQDASGTLAFNSVENWTNATNVVTTRGGYDANATTLDAIADNLGTLISDLKAVGILS